MKTKLLSAAILSLVLFSAFIAIAIDGKWGGKTFYNGSEISLTYNFKVSGETVTGNMDTPYGSGAIENGKLKGDQLSFSANISGMEVTHTGKVYADSIAVDVTAGESVVHTTLTRSK